MPNCRLCRQDGVVGWLDLGPQALRNRFLRSRDEAEFLHPCKVGVCRQCGTVQLESAVPVEEMRPRFAWVRYTEPEWDLDVTVPLLASLPGITPDSVVAGATRNDESTLRRLNALGLGKTFVLDPRIDLGVESPFGGLESFQERLTLPTAERLAEKYGRPDVLVVRYLLEHAQDARAMLQAVRTFVRPGGYVLFAVPDAVKPLERLDYTTLWEEHLLYFTPATLRSSLAAAGFDVVDVRRFCSAQEDSLVAVARSAGGPALPQVSSAELAGELSRADRFIREFPRVRDRVREKVGRFTRAGRKVAMLGAGHLTAGFVNLYGLAEGIDFVADDNPNKHGLFMPGSRAPILPSAELVDRRVELCLMTVRTEVEEAVVARNAPFTGRGGILASVFRESKYALDMIPITTRKAG
ncbi:MAG: hypothetical protein JWO38_509 [Gemmataceae bacterium]|nr:hypothetical protein [Gemmataceae bacterium]